MTPDSSAGVGAIARGRDAAVALLVAGADDDVAEVGQRGPPLRARNSSSTFVQMSQANLHRTPDLDRPAVSFRSSRLTSRFP